jgi:S-(hydroxymethyl)glutathione dehydrogenase/alcohol dehydrogenase
MRKNHAPLEIEEVQIDDPGPGEVLLKTAASGICHSDLHVIEGSLPVPPPCILGHEPAGVVEAVGAGVVDFAPGDHVIGCLTSWCGVCKFCTAGRPYLCPTQFAGRPPGSKPRLRTKSGDPLPQFANLSSFAEKMLCPERSLVKIRDDMPLDRASLIGYDHSSRRLGHDGRAGGVLRARIPCRRGPCPRVGTG